MTVIRPNSISGVTSITALANEINVFRHNGVLAGLQLNGVNHHTSAGVSTFHTVNVLGNLDVAGVLTYQDVTNVDSLGIGTFRTGINVSGGQLDVGSNIKLGNAGVVTATSFVGDGSNLTGLASDRIFEGNTKAEVSDTGSNGRFFVETEGIERFSINSIGYATFSGSLSQFQGATFAQDVSIADTIKHTGDTNTRIRFPANDTISFQTAGNEAVSINSEGAISVQSVLTGNTALAFLRNTRTRASGNKYGIEFRDNINEANANIVIQQNASGNNAAHMDFYINGGTGGNGLENGNHTLRLKQGGDVAIPTGGIEFRNLSNSPAQAAPAFINLGGTHSNAAGNGTNLNAKLKVWSDGTDMMGLSVSSNQLDYIVTQEVYDHVWYGGNSGTSELMRLEGDGDLILTNGNKLNINKSQAAGQYGALLNIGWDGGTSVATKAIDIGGGWSAGENKRITFSHSSGTNNLVGEINSIHYGGTPSRTVPHSGLRFGKLYHNGDSTTYTMSLDSSSATTADLNLRGAYRSSHHPAFCVSGSSMSNFSTTTKIQYTTHGTHGVNQDGFDNSNDRFVAPVDGVYHFYVRHWYQSGTANSTVWLYFYRNGSQIKEVRTAYGSSAPGEYVTVQLSTTVFLSATNYIEVYGQSTNNALHPSSGSFHTEFSGFMVC